MMRERGNQEIIIAPNAKLALSKRVLMKNGRLINQEGSCYSKCHVNSDQLYQGALRIEAKKWMEPEGLTGFFSFSMASFPTILNSI